MKDKGWFSKNIYKNRRIYTLLFLFYALVMLAIFVYYHNMRDRTYVAKGAPDGSGKGELVVTAERSKEWYEHSFPGYDTGMEYDFRITNMGDGGDRLC